MDYNKLERWVLDLLEEENVDQITNIYILAGDIVSIAKEIAEEHQSKIVEQIKEEKESAKSLVTPGGGLAHYEGVIRGLNKALKIIRGETKCQQ